MTGRRASTVLLTGATGGIGRAIAARLAADGARLIISARHHDQLGALRQGLPDPDRVLTVEADLVDATDRSNLLRRARSEFGVPDVVVLAAGCWEVGPLERVPAQAVARMVELNVTAQIQLAQACIPWMLERGSGQIIALASLAGRLGMPYASVYAATKAAVAEWCLSADQELAERGVRVSALCPGFVHEAGLFARLGRSAPGLLGSVSPERVAEATADLIRSPRPQALVTARPARPMLVGRALSTRLVAWLSRRTGVTRFLRSLSAERSADG